jgi:hypothetical protein
MGLVRFRANPKKVTVKVAKCDEGWRVIVDCGWRMACVIGPKPRVAAMRALRMVKDEDGVDLGMQWTYEHPFGHNESVK